MGDAAHRGTDASGGQQRQFGRSDLTSSRQKRCACRDILTRAANVRLRRHRRDQHEVAVLDRDHSCWITASAPPGAAPPVKMRAASPALQRVIKDATGGNLAGDTQASWLFARRALRISRAERIAIHGGVVEEGKLILCDGVFRQDASQRRREWDGLRL